MASQILLAVAAARRSQLFKGLLHGGHDAVGRAVEVLVARVARLVDDVGSKVAGRVRKEDACVVERERLQWPKDEAGREAKQRNTEMTPLAAQQGQKPLSRQI